MRVLLVEDEHSVATAICRALTAEGYRIDVAHDGEQGLSLALGSDYDIVLLDVMVPKVNGYEICRTLRRNHCRAAIIMITAKAGEWDVAEGLDLGADDYLIKPFSMVVLLARMRARVRGPGGGGGGGSLFTNGGLRFDPIARRCWRGTTEIELTGRETSVLTVLFQHVGDVVTKADLLERAWSPRTHRDPNVVEVYIGRLRRKIDEPFGAHDLETVRGEGYRLHGDRSAPESS